MADESAPVRPVRVWPVVALALVYWALVFGVMVSDLAMFPRFMTKALGSLVFLLVFLVLWFTNGAVKGRIRLLGFGVFLAALVAGASLAHRNFDPFSFVMTTVPLVLTVWAAGLLLLRLQPQLPAGRVVIAAILLPVIYVDLLRWEGTDARLRATNSWRWQRTEEQKFLEARAGTAVDARSMAWTLKSGDWPEFRGPQRDGAARGVRIATDWKGAPPQNVWKERIGPGWSSLIVVDRYLVTQEQRGESEAIVAYLAETGQELWCHLTPARFEEGISGAGPRATPTFRDGRIYALGARGTLTCLEASNGKVVWSNDLAKETSAPAPMWGFSASPLLADGKVIVIIGGPSARGTIALHAGTGALVWAREGGKESYSSAHLVTFGGKPQIVIQDNKRTAGLSVADGAVLWERPGISENIIPMIQPQQLPDGTLLLSSGEDLARIEVREEAGKWTVTEKWLTKKFKPSFNDFVVHDNHAYGLDGGILSCVDLRTGERVWKSGRFGGGQVLLLADQGVLIVVSEQGEAALVEAKPQPPGEVFRFQALQGKSWSHPTVVGDRLYLRNNTEMACYRLRGP